jgi:Tol biopolymer transport system component
MHASCTGAPATQEALLVMQGSPGTVLADVSDARNPRPICTITGVGTPQLVTQTTISWSATQGGPGAPGDSLVGVLDLFTGTSTVAASWTGGAFMDGLHAWTPDRSLLAYVTSDATAVNLHLLSGGGDRVVATLGPVPGRGANPNEDDAYLGFSPDGAYFAFVQTYSSSGDHLQVRHTQDGSLAYSQPLGTMATWGSSGSVLYFRKPVTSVVSLWDTSGVVTQAFGQQVAWIRPRADAGDDNLAFTARDSAGTPHVWLYGHGGRSGGQLANVRSSPVWLNANAIFDVEEAPCGSNCGIGPASQPDGKTFTFDTATQTESPSRISQVLSAWPRPGQT